MRLLNENTEAWTAAQRFISYYSGRPLTVKGGRIIARLQALPPSATKKDIEAAGEGKLDFSKGLRCYECRSFVEEAVELGAGRSDGDIVDHDSIESMEEYDSPEESYRICAKCLITAMQLINP